VAATGGALPLGASFHGKVAAVNPRCASKIPQTVSPTFSVHHRAPRQCCDRVRQVRLCDSRLNWLDDHQFWGAQSFLRLQVRTASPRCFLCYPRVLTRTTGYSPSIIIPTTMFSSRNLRRHWHRCCQSQNQKPRTARTEVVVREVVAPMLQCLSKFDIDSSVHGGMVHFFCCCLKYSARIEHPPRRQGRLCCRGRIAPVKLLKEGLCVEDVTGVQSCEGRARGCVLVCVCVF
jgi:hypothetical protein